MEVGEHWGAVGGVICLGAETHGYSRGGDASAV